MIWRDRNAIFIYAWGNEQTVLGLMLFDLSTKVYYFAHIHDMGIIHFYLRFANGSKMRWEVWLYNEK